MHVVVWTAAGERYAIETSVVEEVVPVVEPRRLDRAPDWIAGLINYRGSLIPLLDVRSLLGKGSAEVRRSSRILVVRLPGGDGDGEVVGLLVESLEGVDRHDFQSDGARPALHNPEAPFLGPMALSDGDTVQLVLIEGLLQEEHRDMLFDRTSEPQP